ncbi:MAG: fibronectin type III domain-containing protein, partial [Bacteroidales bacterium]|nr:fibronectin type III domain-containing protein [Bacteroidales bacterium]
MKRKKLLLMLLLAVLLPWAAFGQETLTVCDGTIQNTYIPAYGLYVDTQGTTSEFVIPADSLTDMVGGTISELTFHVATYASAAWTATFYVYLAEVDNTVVTSITGHDAATVVYTGTLDATTATMTVPLNDEYIYEGGNLLVGTYVSVAGNWKSANFYGVETTTSASFNSYTGSAYNFLPKTTFTYTAGTMSDVPKPTDLEVSDITDSSAVIAWTENGIATEWQICLNDDEENLIDVNENPYALEGLTSQTTYKVKVRAYDESDGYSNWSSSKSFATTCGSSTIPYTCGFETAASFDCWTVFAGASLYSYHTHTGSYCLKFAGTTSNMVALPPMGAPTNTLRLEFWTHPESATNTNCGSFAVGYLTNLADAESFVALETYASTDWTSASYVKKVVDFNGAAVPENAVIALRQFNCYTNWYWFVDDVTVKTIPSCLEPSNLSASDVTTNSVQLSWTSNDDESSWTLYYKKEADTDYTTQAVTTNPYTLSGLDPASVYECYVVANCSSTDQSDASEVCGFTTECEVITEYPYTENFDGFDVPTAYTPSTRTLPPCWSAINTTSYSTYAVYPSIYYYATTNYANSTPNCLHLYSYDSYDYDDYSDYDPQPQYAILPEMENLAGKQVALYARSYYSTTPFKVGTMTDPADVSTFELIGTEQATSTYDEYTFAIPATTTAHYVAIMIDAASYSTVSIYIDDITVDLPPACPKPTDLAAADVTGHTAVLSWTSDATAWQICLNGDEENLIDVTENPYTLTNLDEVTSYTAKVRASCGNDVVSDWSKEVSFTTPIACPAPTSLAVSDITGHTATLNWTGSADSYDVFYAARILDPFASYDFESGEIPAAFTNGTTPWQIYQENPNSGSYCIASGNYNVNSSTSDITMTATFESDGCIEFYSRISSESVSWDYGTFLIDDVQQLKEGGTTPNTWAKHSYDVSQGEHTFTWKYTKDSSTHNGEDRYYIDDISLNAVNVTWTTVSTTENTYILTDLDPETTYLVKVMSACEGEVGHESNTISFTTDVSCMAPNALAVADVTSSSAVLSWTSDATSWQLCLNDDESNLITVADNPYTLDGLDESTTYTAKVRANCGSEGYSEWSSPVGFTTLVLCPAPSDLSVNDITGHEATLTWTGDGDSYNVYYRKAAYEEGFNEQFNTSSIPSGWERYTATLQSVLDGGALLATTSTLWSFGTYNGVFDSHARINIYGSSCANWLVSPSVSVETAMPLTFDLALTAFSGTVAAPATTGTDDKFVVLVTTDNCVTWTVLRQWDNAGSEYVYNDITCSATGEQVSFDLSSYVGQTVRIAFYGESTVSNADNNVHIDNVHIGNTIPAGEWMTAATALADTTFTLTNLDAETDYEAKVESICDGVAGHESEILAFTTDVSCMVPTNLAANDITTNSAVLSWTANSGETSWTLYYKKSDDTAFASIEVAANPYTLSGLDSGTDYDFYVVANCSSTDQSEASAVFSFQTECEAITTFPYTENFDGMTGGTSSTVSVMPNCWNRINTSTYYYYAGYPTVYAGESYANSPSNCLRFYSYYSSSSYTDYDPQPQYAILPEMENLAGMQISLYAKGYSTTSTFKVGTMTDPADASTFVMIAEQALTTSHQEFIYLIPEDVTAHYVAIMIDAADADRYSNGVNIDDITIQVPPACAKPTGLEVGEVTAHTAALSWTSDASAWQICLNGDEENLIDATENPFTIEGIADGMSYTAKVRANCGSDGFSEWTDEVSFTTPIACPAPTNVAISDITGHTATATWEGNSDSYDVFYRQAEYVDGLGEKFKTSSIPAGWSRYSGLMSGVLDGTVTMTAVTSGWYFGTYNGVFDSHARVNVYGTSCKYWLVSPSFTMDEAVPFTFDLALTAYSGTVATPSTTGTDDKFVVLASTDNGATWTILRQWDNAGSEYVFNNITCSATGEQVSIDLSAYVGQNLQIAFYCESTSSNADNNIHIDNIRIGTPYPAGEWITAAEDLATTTCTITGLDPETEYEVFVESNCDGEEGHESSIVSFFTDVACSAPSGLVATNIGPHSFDLSWTSDGESWQVQVNDEEPIDASTNPYTVEGLDPETEYTVKVLANCGDEGYSQWSDAITVVTSVACPAPTDLVVTDITAQSATLSWTGYSDSYNLSYAVVDNAMVKVTLRADNVWSDGSGYQMLLDADATAFGTVIPTTGSMTSSGDADDAVYAEFEYKIPENADGSLTTSNIVMDSSITIYIPAGTYDWCIANPTPGDRVWIASGGGSIGGRHDDYVFEYGKEYEFYVYYGGENDATDLTVTETDLSDLEWNDITGVDTPYTLTGLSPETAYVVKVQADCDEDGESSWAMTTFATTESTGETEQTVTLNSGWSWFSSYVEFTDESLGQLEAGIAANGNSGMIKSSSSGYVTYSGSSWTGSLTELNNEQMYLISSNGGEISLTGTLVDPTAHPITLNSGWTWIGFLSANEMTVADALAGIEPSENDMIKGQGNYATYANGAWKPSITLVPGQGYLYQRNGEGTILVYPSSSKGVVETTPVETYWNTDRHAFPTNLTMMLTLDESVFGMAEGSHEIGAFVDGECRGSARLTNVDGKYVAFLTVSGENAETVNFRLYDVTTGSVYGSANESISYKSDDIYGTASNPMVLHFRNTGVGEFDGAVSLFP